MDTPEYIGIGHVGLGGGGVESVISKLRRTTSLY